MHWIDNETFNCGTVDEYLRFLEREREREWWCLELLGDLDDSIVCFL